MARYIQRAFRGFQGRALFRRLCVRLAERQRQRRRVREVRLPPACGDIIRIFNLEICRVLPFKLLFVPCRFRPTTM